MPPPPDRKNIFLFYLLENLWCHLSYLVYISLELSFRLFCSMWILNWFSRALSKSALFCLPVFSGHFNSLFVVNPIPSDSPLTLFLPHSCSHFILQISWVITSPFHVHGNIRIGFSMYTGTCSIWNWDCIASLNQDGLNWNFTIPMIKSMNLFY